MFRLSSTTKRCLGLSVPVASWSLMVPPSCRGNVTDTNIATLAGGGAHRHPMTHFEARAGLDEEVAMRIALPTVRRMAAQVRDRAQRNAPDAKVWVTAHDERVRPSHEHADG